MHAGNDVEDGVRVAAGRPSVAPPSSGDAQQRKPPAAPVGGSPIKETTTPPETLAAEGFPAAFSSRGRTRTYDKPVNSRLLYQLSYAGMTDGKT
jgi:hypothetical protein